MQCWKSWKCGTNASSGGLIRDAGRSRIIQVTLPTAQNELQWRNFLLSVPIRRPRPSRQQQTGSMQGEICPQCDGRRLIVYIHLHNLGRSRFSLFSVQHPSRQVIFIHSPFTSPYHECYSSPITYLSPALSSASFSSCDLHPLTRSSHHCIMCLILLHHQMHILLLSINITLVVLSRLSSASSSHSLSLHFAEPPGSPSPLSLNWGANIVPGHGSIMVVFILDLH